MTTQHTPHDWSEDAQHENGNYNNVCIHCNAVFIGYKRRIVCKRCDTLYTRRDIPSTSKPYPDEH